MTSASKDSRHSLAAPRAAATAGVISSVLLIVSLGLVRLAVPADPTAPGGWLADPGRRDAVRVALNLVPIGWAIDLTRSSVDSHGVSRSCTHGANTNYRDVKQDQFQQVLNLNSERGQVSWNLESGMWDLESRSWYLQSPGRESRMVYPYHARC